MTKAACCLSDKPLPVRAHHRAGTSKLFTAQVMSARPEQAGPGGVWPQLQLQQADTHVPAADVLQPQAARFQPRAAGTPAPSGSSAEVQAVTAPSAASYEIIMVFSKGRSEQCVAGKLHGLLCYNRPKSHAGGGKRASAAQCIAWAKEPETFMTASLRARLQSLRRSPSFLSYWIWTVGRCSLEHSFRARGQNNQS